MKILRFPALRPANPLLAQRIASLPYDVMDTAEARRMAEGNPDCFLRVVRSEVALPSDTDPHADIVYAKASETLAAFRADGRLTQDGTPSIYIYRQTMGAHRQTAVVACCPIDDYANGTILRHEKTRKDKEDDRTRHILETRAHTGQVFLTYADDTGIDALVALEVTKAPLYDFTAVDGIRHTVWKAEGAENLVAAFERVPRAYIADGHHRSAASYRAGMEMRQRRNRGSEEIEEAKKSRKSHEGESDFSEKTESDGFMASLFPASQLRILPYNRLVLSFHAGMTAEKLLAEARRIFDSVEPTAHPAPTSGRSCCMYVAGNWWRLGWTVAANASPIGRLDVSVLQDRLLGPILGIDDPRTSPRIAFLGGIRGTEELRQRVDRGEAVAAFSMYPTTVSEMMAIADAGEIMPPKSTWFEPKLRSGLLIHCF